MGDQDPAVTHMMAVVIQEQDIHNASHALVRLGLKVIRMPSTGGFLGRRNATLLIGLARGQEEAAVKAIQKHCKKRVEYLATPLEGVHMPIPLATPVTVGGATVFTIAVERFEEL